MCRSAAYYLLQPYEHGLCIQNLPVPQISCNKMKLAGLGHGRYVLILQHS